MAEFGSDKVRTHEGLREPVCEVTAKGSRSFVGQVIDGAGAAFETEA
ncbi:hypothetical protein [Streptomyces microflavus]